MSRVGSRSEMVVELTWKKTLAVWWSIFWRGTLLGVLFGGLFGAVTGGVLGAQGFPQDRIPIYGALAGYAGGIIASIVAIKLAIQKHLPSLIASAAPAGYGYKPDDGLRRGDFEER